MEIKVLGISGSPIKDGNVETFLSKILESVSSKPGVSTEMASLAKLDIRDCQHCNYCIRNQTKRKYCSIKDDAQPLLEKVESSDILVLATPVYFMRTSGRMAAFIDRLRMFMFGNLTKGRLRSKLLPAEAGSFEYRAKALFKKITKNIKRLAVGLHRSYKNIDFGSADSILKSSPKGEGFSPIPREGQ